MVINAFGDPSVFTEAELARPEVSNGHVLIKVVASSVNPVDCKIRQGKLAAIAPGFPAILHGDVAGIVVQIGDGVAHLQIGDEVYACAGGVKGRQGALAEYMLAEAALVVKKPTNLTLPEAAALPLVFITAWEALIDRATVQAGQTLLIYGGTGGVGSAGIQLAKWKGAHVVTTAGSPEKIALAKQVGADDVINYNEVNEDDLVERFTAGRGFDVVFDTVGGEHLQHAFQAAAVNGTVVTTSARVQQDLSLMHSKALSLHVVFMLLPMLTGGHTSAHGRILTQLAELVGAGLVKPLLSQVSFGFSHVADAHTFWEAGQAVGKVVLKNDLTE